MADIQLHFAGPMTFTAGEKSVFHTPSAKSPGIYLWTMRQRKDGSHLIHYVGETLSLAKRHREHLIHILGMNYGIFDPEDAQSGVRTPLWNGLWRDKTSDGPSKLIEAYQSTHEGVVSYVAALNVFFAELRVETRLRKHVEGCIGWHLRNSHPEAEALYPKDNHVGTMKERGHGDLLITSAEPICGLDSRIPY